MPTAAVCRQTVHWLVIALGGTSCSTVLFTLPHHAAQAGGAHMQGRCKVHARGRHCFSSFEPQQGGLHCDPCAAGGHACAVVEHVDQARVECRGNHDLEYARYGEHPAPSSGPQPARTAWLRIPKRS